MIGRKQAKSVNWFSIKKYYISKLCTFSKTCYWSHATR